MNPDHATSEIKELILQLYEAQAEKNKWVLKKENALKDLKRTEADSKTAGRGSQFTNLEELFRKRETTIKNQLDECNKEIAKYKAMLNQLADSYATSLVKHLPVDEIKDRQLSDKIKTEFAKHSKSTSSDSRLEKLEGHIASLQNTQKTQSSDIHRLSKENGQLRTWNSGYEAKFNEHATEIALLKTQYDDLHKSTEATATQQATKLASIETQYERLQFRFDNDNSKADSEVKTLRQDKETLKSDVSGLEEKLAALARKVESQQEQFTAALREVRTRSVSAPAPAPVDAVSRQEFTVVQKEVAASRESIKEHETRLASFDPQDYEEGRSKLFCFPRWEDVDDRITSAFRGLEEKIEKVQSATASAEHVQAVGEDVAKVKADLTEIKQTFKGFSDQTLVVIGRTIKALQDRVSKVEAEVPTAVSRIKGLEDRTANAHATQTQPTSSATGNASGSSNRDGCGNGDNFTAELTAISSRVHAMEIQFTNLRGGLQNDLNLLRNEYTTCASTVGAHETMIMSLDDQFKNMTTSHMAQIILEALKKLLPGTISLDVQNIHERLVTLEAFREKQLKCNNNMYKLSKMAEEELGDKKRSCVEETAGPQEKRQRRGGLSELVNGI